MLPKITFRPMTFKENMDLIAMFIYEELDSPLESRYTTNFFKDKYSEIADTDFSNMPTTKIAELLQYKLKTKWLDEMKNSKEIIQNMQNSWDDINDEVMQNLAKRLNIEWPKDYQDIEAKVGIIILCPRDIGSRTFYMRIPADMGEMKQIALHEICHFLYFEKWQKLFNDYDEEHYNKPNIIWYLSEALIDPLLNNDIFRKYTVDEIRSYDIFYKTLIEGESIVVKLRKIVEEQPIEQAIRDCYALFKKYENIIKEILF